VTDLEALANDLAGVAHVTRLRIVLLVREGERLAPFRGAERSAVDWA
jgi:hypothetical protein